MGLSEFFTKIISRGFILLFFLVPLIFVADTSELFEFNKMMLTYGLTIVIVGAWLAKMAIEKKFIFKHTFLEIPLLLYLGSHVLSTVFSIDPHISIWGYYSRFHEGLLASFSYVLLYFAAVSNLKKDDVKKIIWSSFISAAIISIWGALEHLGHSPSCYIVTGKFNADCWIQDVKSRVFATLGQPNWMAAYLDVLIMSALGMLFVIKEDSKKVAVTVLALLFFCALLFTKSRSGVLGLGIGLAIFSVVVLIKEKTKILTNRFILLTALGVLLAAFMFGLPFAQTERFSLEKMLAPKTLTPVATSSGAPSELFISASEDIRKPVWEGAIKVWQRYPIFGSGVETFAYSFYLDRPASKNMDSEWDFLYNKAHNEYLNILATTGTVGFIAYLSIIAIFSLWFIRRLRLHKAEETLIASLFAAWISILVTNFFGFSIVIIGVLFFLIPAFCEILSSGDVAKPNVIAKNYSLNLGQMGLMAAIILIGLLAEIHLLARWQADKDYNLGKAYDSQQQFIAALTPLSKAVESVPDEPTFRDELSYNQAVLASLVFDQLHNSTSSALADMSDSDKMGIKIPQLGMSVADLRDLAILNSDLVVTQSPHSVPFWKTRVRTFYQLVKIDNKYFDRVVEAINTAAVLAPTDAKVRYNLGLILKQAGKTSQAIAALEETVNLKPDYRDAHYTLGQYYAQQNELAKAQEQMEYIVRNIGPDKDAIEWLKDNKFIPKL